MEYFKASEDHAEQIYNLVQNTITAVYPRYYPEAVVDPVKLEDIMLFLVKGDQL